MVPLRQLQTTGRRFIRATSKRILGVWVALILFDLWMIQLIGASALDFLSFSRVESVLGEIVSGANGAAIAPLAMLGIMVSGALRKALWFSVRKAVIEGESLRVPQILTSSAMKSFVVLAAQQTLGLVLLAVSLLCFAIGLLFPVFPQMLAYFALAPAIYIIVTQRRGFFGGFGLAAAWTRRHFSLVFGAQAVGLVAGQVLSGLLGAAWAQQQGPLVALGSASLYIAISWVSWACESTVYLSIDEAES